MDSSAFQFLSQSDSFLLGVGLVLALVWSGLGLFFFLKQTLLPSARSVWMSRSPITRFWGLLFWGLLIAYGGRTPKESPQPAPRLAPARAHTDTSRETGYALTVVSTNPVPSLSLPPSGSSYSPWMLRGAHDDSFHVDSHTRIFSSGELWVNDLRLRPFRASLGIVPEANWSKISAPSSLFWHDTTSYGSRRFTWQSVLYERATHRPISFQAELFSSGNIVYRYDFGDVQPTNSSIGILQLGAEEMWQGPINSRFLELHWTAYDPASVDPDGDGLSTLDEVRVFYTNPSLADSDYDGISDFLDEAPTIPSGPSSESPDVGDGFGVTVSLTESPSTPIALLIGDESITIPANSPTNSPVFIRLPEGVANPVTLYATENTTLGFYASLNSPSSFFSSPLSAFSSPCSIPGKQALPSGFIAQPLLSTEPARLCFHSTNAFEAALCVAPELPGVWHCQVDASAQTNDPLVPIPYPASCLSASFHATGALAAVQTNYPITTCRLAQEPQSLDALEDGTTYLLPQTDGEPQLSRLRPFDTSGAFLHKALSINNDDDDASHALDLGEASLASPDNDLTPFYPLGRYDGTCCPCPEHRIAFAPSATLLSAASSIALYTDPGKTNALSVGDSVSAGQCLYAEGRSASTALADATLLWQSAADPHAVLTNDFTVLSLRLFPDLNSDQAITPEDVAQLSRLSPEHGWILAGDFGALRPLQLVNDVGLPGIHTLSLTGEGFSLWESAIPGPSDVPLLTSGHTLTNVITDTTTLYVQAPTNGTAELLYAFEGDGLSCSTRLRMTALGIDLELLARDPETGDEYECTGLAHVSHPVPQVSFSVDHAYLSSDTLYINVHSTFVDPLSETCDPIDRVQQLHLYHCGEEIASWDVLYSTSNDVCWQKCSSEDEIFDTLPIRNPEPGLHLFTLKTDENLAGESGSAFGYVLLGEEQDEPTSRTPEISISVTFPATPVTNALDTATLLVGTNSFALVEIGATNFPPDLRFESLTHSLCATEPLSGFSNDTADCFYATLRDFSSPSVTNLTQALFEETSPTSLCFQGTAIYDSEPGTHLVVLETGSFEGTQEGFIEPFVGNVKITPPPCERSAASVLQEYGLSFRLQGEETPMDVAEFYDEIYLVETASSPPRLFVALENTSAGLPYDAWQNHCLTFELVTTNGLVVAAYDTWLTDPAFGEEAEDETLSPLRASRASPLSSPARSWSVEEAWLCFELLFGEAGSTIREYYTNFGGTVIKAETSGWTWRSYEQLNFGDWDRDLPIIVLDDDLSNALQAALALERALRRTNSLLFMRYDYRRYVIESIHDALADDPTALEQLQNFWYGGYENLSDTIASIELALEMGVSLLPEDGDIVIDFSHAFEDANNGEYGTLALCLTSRLGNIYSTSRKLFKGVDLVITGRTLRWADEVTETIIEAANCKKRADRIALLRPMIRSGEIDGQTVEMLYDIGILKASGRHSTVLENFLPKVTDKRGLERHHITVIQLEKNFLKVGIDPDTIGEWLPKQVHRNLHKGKGCGHGGMFNYQWAAFFGGRPCYSRNGVDITFDKDAAFGPQYQKVIDFVEVLKQEIKKSHPNWPFSPLD